MTIVVDASVVVAALIDTTTTGAWAEATIAEHDLAAPHLMPIQSTQALRRAERTGQISADRAALAHADMTRLPVVFFGYEVVAMRVWELRANLSAYDAWYVALAELLEVPLATLEARLASAPGPHCEFVTPTSG